MFIIDNRALNRFLKYERSHKLVLLQIMYFQSSNIALSDMACMSAWVSAMRCWKARLVSAQFCCSVLCSVVSRSSTVDRSLWDRDLAPAGKYLRDS